MIKGNLWLHEVARARSTICQALSECQSASSIFIRTWPAVKCCKSVLLHLILVAIAANTVTTKQKCNALSYQHHRVLKSEPK